MSDVTAKPAAPLDEVMLAMDVVDTLRHRQDLAVRELGTDAKERQLIDKLRDIYKRSYIVIMNREEAVDVTGASYDSLHDIAQAFHELGPEIAVITDGPNGSYASYDGKLVTVPNYPDPAPPYERTGAGDAFASTIVAALALGESMDTAMLWAPINSAYVVQKMGAQQGLLTYDELHGYLTEAPEWYKVKEVER